ncbi:hypothetical protein P152DRAFT_471288 [Eremomyces bilateralis CBS 781.70]|uniref:Uncharacterized protein n=1 Tax=Eremomyces bilateralis CBS 781.70 TaxID=1392243 RepID=A0A6G1GDE0_9PEZI|nr:uncharacterized protein P152DRAFT_471288 [Eremomyces bilateralis CBS 781.70]KAF1815911.1 hypothetical protein P152DRAFT_471288 [Eremomyces bilateralis CBS 781.70]
MVAWGDQQLAWALCVILKECDIKVTPKDLAPKIVELWPAEFGPKPTVSAVTDRFSRLKRRERSKIEKDGSMKSGRHTPSGRVWRTKSTPTSGKRVRDDESDSDSDAVNDALGLKTPSRRHRERPNGNGDAVTLEPRRKSPRKPKPISTFNNAMDTLLDGDMENEYPSEEDSYDEYDDAI